MTNEQLKEVIAEVKEIADENHTPYEVLCSVLRAADDTEKRMVNVSSYPRPLSK